MMYLLGLLLSVVPPDSAALVIQTSLPYTLVVRDSLFHEARRVESGDSLWMSPGSHNLTFLHPDHFDVSMDIVLTQGFATEVRIRPVPMPYREYWRYSSYFRVANKASVVVNTDHDTQVRVNGRYAGFGPQALDLDPGLMHTVVLIPKMGDPVRHRVELTKYRFEVVEDYRRPRRITTALLGPLMGVAQIHKGEELKGAALMSVAVVGIFMSGRHFGDAQEHRQSWMRHTHEADKLNPGPAKSGLLAEAAHSYGMYRNSMYLRGRWLGVLAGASAIGFLDALFPPEGGFQSRKNRIRPILTGQGEVGLRVRVD